MAYQNFFSSATNYRRQNPATTSGKEVSSEFRMRNEGSSALVCSCEGVNHGDGTISTTVTVRDPNTGDTKFTETFTCKK